MRLIITALIGLLIGISGIAQNHYMYATEEVAEAEMKAFNRSYKSSTINRSNRGYFDVTKQILELEVSPGIHYIEGLVETQFSMLLDGYDYIELNCSDSLIVNEVTLDNVPVSFSHENNFLLVRNSTAFKKNTNHILKIKYEGKPQKTRAFVADTNIYGDSVLWTLSEPYGAKDWWPCKQDLEDKIDELEISITVPKKYTAASNGVLQTILPVGPDSLKYTFKHNFPIVTYLVAFAVAEYSITKETLSLQEGNLDFVNYIYPQDTAEAREDMKEFKKTMDLFETLFGPYPFKDELYGHAQFGWGGGMEHQTMSFMVHFKHGLVAHELAHQWFGNLVTCGSWKDLWLNESFATYAEGLTYEYLFDENVWEDWKSTSIAASTEETGGSVYIPDTSNVSRMFSSRLTYRKGSYLLHMLRYKLGDEQFFQALRDYLYAENTTFGFGRTQDLIWHLKANGGEDIDEFFNDWFYAQGHPLYELEWHQTENEKLHLVLSQEQSYIWEGTFFDMDVPVRIVHDFGDTTLYLKHRQNVQEWIIDWPKELEIRTVELDPDRWILKGESTVNPSNFSNEWIAYKIVPNPVQNDLSLVFSGATLPDVRLDIFDIMGNRVYSNTIETGIAQKVIHLDVSFLSNGAYTLRVKDNWSQRSLKFIKANRL